MKKPFKHIGKSYGIQLKWRCETFSDLWGSSIPCGTTTDRGKLKQRRDRTTNNANNSNNSNHSNESLCRGVSEVVNVPLFEVASFQPDMIQGRAQGHEVASSKECIVAIVRSRGCHGVVLSASNPWMVLSLRFCEHFRSKNQTAPTQGEFVKNDFVTCWRLCFFNAFWLH